MGPSGRRLRHAERAANVREYLALHQAPDVGPGDRVLDLARSAGLAVELNRVRGAVARRPIESEPGEGSGAGFVVVPGAAPAGG